MDMGKILTFTSKVRLITISIIRFPAKALAQTNNVW